MKTSGLFFLIISLLFGCGETKVERANLLVESQVVSIVDSSQVFPFRLLNEMFKRNRNEAIQNYEVYSGPRARPFFYNWHPKNKLLYVASGPFECKGSGLTGVFFGLDSISILDFENYSLANLNAKDFVRLTFPSAVQIETSAHLVSSSLNSNTCQVFQK